MRHRLFATVLALAIAGAPMTAQAAVYVEDESGTINEYTDVPALPLAGNVHVEYAVGVVTDSDGCGQTLYSTDGLEGYIKYGPWECHEGDVIQSLFYYRADQYGEWEDDIFYRIDITPER